MELWGNICVDKEAEFRYLCCEGATVATAAAVAAAAALVALRATVAMTDSAYVVQRALTAVAVLRCRLRGQNHRQYLAVADEWAGRLSRRLGAWHYCLPARQVVAARTDAQGRSAPRLRSLCAERGTDR